MPDNIVFQSRLAWDCERPETLTLVDLIPKDFNFFRRRIQSLVAAHGTRRIVSIGHQDCSWYLERRIGPFKIDLEERQLRDLRRASA